MPLCKFCIYASVNDFNKYGEVFCKKNGRYYYKLEQINSCQDYEATNGSSLSDQNRIEKGIKSYSRKKRLDYDETYEKLTDNKACFITTTVCDILKYPDDTPTLTLLRNLRDNFMIGNDNYTELLLEYNVVGPMISSCLTKEKARVNFAKQLYNNYLLPSAKLTLYNRYEEAVNLYIAMVDELKERYSLTDIKFEYNKTSELKNKDDFKKAITKVYK